MVEARFEPQLSANVQSLSRAHVNYYEFLSHFPYRPEEGGMQRQTYNGLWAGAEQRFVFALSPVTRITAGAEGQNHFLADQFTSIEIAPPGSPTTVLDDHRSFQVGAAYVVAEATKPTWKVSMGGRADAYSTFGASFNPRVAFIFRPYDAGNVKIMGGKAFRAPSIYELYFSGGGQVTNPDLQPEQIYSAEIEYTHRFTPTTLALGSIWGNYIQSLIAQRDVDPTAGTFRYENTRAPVVSLGTEAEVRREWKDGWMVGASYSFQRSRYLLDETWSSLVSLKHNPGLREVANSPMHMASVRGAAPIVGRALLAMMRVTLEGPRYDRNDRVGPDEPPQRQTDVFVVWDLVFSGTEPRLGLRYSFGAYNLLDWHYALPVSSEFRQTTVMQSGRTFLASIAATF
jgi:outer membrane receptor protein involved in Fe transport